MKLVLDAARSHVKIRTFAEGFLAKLAHDLELVCRDLSGRAERRGEDDGIATVDIPIGKIGVNGVLKNGKLDPNGLSAFERDECLSKMRKDVFQSSAGAVVRVEVETEARSARVRFALPNGRVVVQNVPIRVADDGPNGINVSGTLSLSLQAVGSAPVRAPMNAFRVKDVVELSFDVVFTEAR